MDAASIAPAMNRTERAAPQHLQALARANRVRLARASIKRSIAAGERSAAEILREAPWETESMTLAELLASQRRWGRTRVRKFLQGLALSEQKRLGSLTHRQRLLVVAELEARTGDREADTAELLVA